MPEQIVNTFEIENQTVEVILWNNEITKHVPVYEIVEEGIELKHLLTNGNVSILLPDMFIEGYL